jgi:hypothetical protein
VGARGVGRALNEGVNRGQLSPEKPGERGGVARGGWRLPRCGASEDGWEGRVGVGEQGWGRAVGGEVWAGGREEGGGVCAWRGRE